MKSNLHIKNGITIPEFEIDITTSRSGGAGGQHVNKTDSRITVRWNVRNTVALSDSQKERALENLKSRLTTDGDLIIHSSTSRSQYQNREMALTRLAQEVREALYVPKKRMTTRVSKATKESRFREKTHRSMIKKMRSTKHRED